MIARRHSFFRRRLWLSLVAIAMFSFGATAFGIILFRTADPAANTTAPAGSLAGSGWQYTGRFGGFLGTAIAPHYFITAKHIGEPSDKFVYHGVDYSIVRHFDDAGDLRIYEVAGTLPIYAPLFTGDDEVGRHLVAIGRGSPQGFNVGVNGKVAGWLWGAGDTVQRWGENEVAAIKELSSWGQMLYALFDQAGLPNEAHLSGGDSGGPVFLKDGSVWKLAGISADVDGPFYTAQSGGGPFFAALFDERGFFDRDRNLIIGAAPVPSGFYASRISSRMSWINSVIEPGLSNISARATVGSGERACIGGFIIQGESKRLAILGLGPSLQTGGVAVPGRLADPVLELHTTTGAVIAFNDDWGSSQKAELEESGLAPGDDKEAAIITLLPAGHYTAVLRGANGSAGIVLLEIYDLDARGSSRLLNLSSRAHVGTGDNVLIGGLIVPSVSRRVLLRVIGPGLAALGVVDELRDPVLELHDANGALLASNDNWNDAQNSAEIAATSLAPANALEPAILTMSGPGTYTAIVRGAGAPNTGVAVLETYLIN